jgi:peptidyl-prolyl cis-trans isomerase D
MAKKRQTTGLPKTGTAKPAPQPTQETPAPSTRVPNPFARTETATQGYRTRAEVEAEWQRRIVLITALAVGAILILLIIAFIFDGIIRPNQPVATVNGDNITVAQFRDRVSIEHELLNVRFSNALAQYTTFTNGDVNQAFQQLGQQEPYATWYNELTFPDTLANRIVNEMVDDEIVEDYAQANGIEVSEEDVDSQINDFLGYDPEAVALIGQPPTETPTPTTTPTPIVSPTPSVVPTETPLPTNTPTTAPVEGAATGEVEPTLDVTAVPTGTATATLSPTEVEGQFITRRDALFDRLRREAGVGDGAIRDYFRTLALREKVSEQLRGESETATYVNARHILVATEEEAQDVLAALSAGESFADLARSVSTDTGSGANGGELDWSPAFQFVEEFSTAVIEAPIGEVVGPIETQFGFHIIQVRDREERELEESQIDQAQGSALQQWITEQRDAEGVNSEVYDTWADNVPNLTFTYNPF